MCIRDRHSACHSLCANCKVHDGICWNVPLSACVFVTVSWIVGQCQIMKLSVDGRGGPWRRFTVAGCHGGLCPEWLGVDSSHSNQYLSDHFVVWGTGLLMWLLLEDVRMALSVVYTDSAYSKGMFTMWLWMIAHVRIGNSFDTATLLDNVYARFHPLTVFNFLSSNNRNSFL